MPNQNECDHTVGYQLVKNGAVQLHSVSEIPVMVLDVRFNYCPNCGAKIDWDKIKEEVDDK